MNNTLKAEMVLLLLLVSTATFAQHMQGIGVSFGANDFYGPQASQYFGDKVTLVTANVMSGKNDTSTKTKLRWEPLVHISYWWQLNRMFDINAAISAGNVIYPSKSDDSAYKAVRQTPFTKEKRLLLELDARINWNIIPKEKHFASPYIFVGISGTQHENFYGFCIPAGIGGNFSLSKNHDAYFNIEAAYKAALSSNDQTHLQYLAGFVFWFHTGHEAPSSPAVPAPATPPPPASNQ